MEPEGFEHPLDPAGVMRDVKNPIGSHELKAAGRAMLDALGNYIFGDLKNLQGAAGDRLVLEVVKPFCFVSDKKGGIFLEGLLADDGVVGMGSENDRGIFFDDPGFFSCDLFERCSEERDVVFTDRGNDREDRLEDVGGVVAAADAAFR